MSVVLEYEMYMPRAHLRKGTLRLSGLLLILNILNWHLFSCSRNIVCCSSVPCVVGSCTGNVFLLCYTCTACSCTFAEAWGVNITSITVALPLWPGSNQTLLWPRLSSIILLIALVTHICCLFCVFCFSSPARAAEIPVRHPEAWWQQSSVPHAGWPSAEECSLLQRPQRAGCTPAAMAAVPWRDPNPCQTECECSGFGYVWVTCWVPVWFLQYSSAWVGVR